MLSWYSIEFICIVSTVVIPVKIIRTWVINIVHGNNKNNAALVYSHKVNQNEKGRKKNEYVQSENYYFLDVQVLIFNHKYDEWYQARENKSGKDYSG